MERDLQHLLVVDIISKMDPGVCPPLPSLFMIVRKKDGGLRICEDYRHINQQNMSYQNPLAPIDEIFPDVHDAHCFISPELLI